MSVLLVTSRGAVADPIAPTAPYQYARESDMYFPICWTCNTRTLAPEKVEQIKQELLRCSRCKRAHYCNPECQKADWRGHKVFCVKEEHTAEYKREMSEISAKYYGTERAAVKSLLFGNGFLFIDAEMPYATYYYPMEKGDQGNYISPDTSLSEFCSQKSLDEIGRELSKEALDPGKRLIILFKKGEKSYVFVITNQKYQELYTKYSTMGREDLELQDRMILKELCEKRPEFYPFLLLSDRFPIDAEPRKIYFETFIRVFPSTTREERDVFTHCIMQAMQKGTLSQFFEGISSEQQEIILNLLHITAS